MGFTPRAGSIPALGTFFLRSYAFGLATEDLGNRLTVPEIVPVSGEPPGTRTPNPQIKSSTLTRPRVST